MSVDFGQENDYAIFRQFGQRLLNPIRRKRTKADWPIAPRIEMDTLQVRQILFGGRFKKDKATPLLTDQFHKDIGSDIIPIDAFQQYHSTAE